MKTLLVLLIATTTVAQISKIETPERILIGLTKILGTPQITIEKSNDTYIFTYKDVNYQQLNEYKSFSFKDEDGAFESLYEMIVEGLKSPPKEDIMLELPNDIVWLHFSKSMGKPYVEFHHAVDKHVEVLGKSTWLNKKKLDKLFGKKKKRK